MQLIFSGRGIMGVVRELVCRVFIIEAQVFVIQSLPRLFI